MSIGIDPVINFYSAECNYYTFTFNIFNYSGYNYDNFLAKIVNFINCFWINLMKYFINEFPDHGYIKWPSGIKYARASLMSLYVYVLAL